MLRRSGRSSKQSDALSYSQPVHLSDFWRQQLYELAYRLLNLLNAPPATYLMQFGFVGERFCFDRGLHFPADLRSLLSAFSCRIYLSVIGIAWQISLFMIFKFTLRLLEMYGKFEIWDWRSGDDFTQATTAGVSAEIIWSKLSKISKSWSSWVISNISLTVAERLQMTKGADPRWRWRWVRRLRRRSRNCRDPWRLCLSIQSLWRWGQSRLAVAGGAARLGSRGSFEAGGWCVGWSWNFP